MSALEPLFSTALDTTWGWDQTAPVGSNVKPASFAAGGCLMGALLWALPVPSAARPKPMRPYCGSAELPAPNLRLPSGKTGYAAAGELCRKACPGERLAHVCTADEVVLEMQLDFSDPPPLGGRGVVATGINVEYDTGRKVSFTDCSGFTNSEYGELTEVWSSQPKDEPRRYHVSLRDCDDIGRFSLKLSCCR